MSPAGLTLMSNQLTNTRCLAEACRRLKLPVKSRDENGNLLSVEIGGRRFFFANYSTPFNSDAVSKIAKDKEFTYRILKDVVPMPRTAGFFDPSYDSVPDRPKAAFRSVEEITRSVLDNFSLPVIIKMNSGDRGVNVFLSRSGAEVQNAIGEIFLKQSRHYDYIALAQDYVPPAREFRAVVFRGRVVLLYEKDFSRAKFVGNLSPLHWEGARAVHVADKEAIADFEKLLTPIFSALPVEFSGLDVLEGKDGRRWLLEMNSQPGFFYFVRDNGEEPVVRMYEKILTVLLNHKS